MTISQVITALPWLFVGAAIGTAYFHLLGRSVAAMGSDWQRAIGFLLLRIVIAVTGFAVVVHYGTLPLIAALLGLLLARTVMIRRVRRA